MNKVVLTGRLTSQPELRYTNSSKAYCHFCIAVKGYQDKTDFINCESWDKQAENLCKYQDKGNMILVEGRILISTYEKNGEKRMSTSIVCNNIEYLQSKNNDNQQSTELHSKDNNDLNMDSDPFADFGDTATIDDDFLE